MRNWVFMSVALLVLASCKNKTEKAVYSGTDLSGKAFIEREKETKKAYFDIDVAGVWKLYAGKSVETIDFSLPLLTGTGKGRFDLPVPAEERTYFQLVTADGKAILAERHLPMTGGFNFRDLGGFKTKEGKYVKWGKFLRSDDLHQLTDNDLNYLASVPVKTIVDFRSEQERAIAPDKHPVSVKNTYDLSISPGNVGGVSIESLKVEDAMKMMEEMNVLFVTDSNCIRQYRKFFEILQDDANTAVLFHCSAGKDRTGMGAALILYALGVDEKTIMEDYLSSNKYLSGKYDSLIEKYPVFKDLFSVHEQYLRSGIDTVKQQHGSVENYLRNILHVDIEKFRKQYLY